MSLHKFGVWLCENEDCYVLSHINQFCEGSNEQLPNNMHDDIYEAMPRISQPKGHRNEFDT